MRFSSLASTAMVKLTVRISRQIILAGLSITVSFIFRFDEFLTFQRTTTSRASFGDKDTFLTKMGRVEG